MANGNHCPDCGRMMSPSRPHQCPLAIDEQVKAFLTDRPASMLGILSQFDIRKRQAEKILKQIGSILDPDTDNWYIPKPPGPKSEPEPLPALELEPEVVEYAPDPVEDVVGLDRETRRQRIELTEVKRKYNRSLDQIEELEVALNAALGFKDRIQPYRITADPSSNKSESVAIAAASDWHLGAKIEPATVNFLNEFNPDIAKRRANTYFVNLLDLIRSQRLDTPIHKLVLWLGGDLIENVLREENLENNYFSPTEEVIFAQDILSSGIRLLLEDQEFKEIHVITSTGNHGRLPMMRPRAATRCENSLETIIYRNLARHFHGADERKTWQVDTGYFNYLQVFGKTIRFSHGDAIKYQGGIGGLTVPALKAIHRANEAIKADLDIIGHFHQYICLRNKIIVNGSLCGTNAYALQLGFGADPPVQAFQLLNSKHGFTGAFPIVVDES